MRRSCYVAGNCKADHIQAGRMIMKAVDVSSARFTVSSKWMFVHVSQNQINCIYHPNVVLMIPLESPLEYTKKTSYILSIPSPRLFLSDRC